MKVKKIYENFSFLKDKIEEDGKIDMFEVRVLLEFLESYKNKKEISSLWNLLIKSKDNGNIAEEDSILIIESIYEALKYFRKEYKIERTLNYTFAFIDLGILFYYLFY